MLFSNIGLNPGALSRSVQDALIRLHTRFAEPAHASTALGDIACLLRPSTSLTQRAIWVQGRDLKTKTMMGAQSVIVNDGVEVAKHPMWIESPHILNKDHQYRLIAAERGTASEHSELVFRGDHVGDPYFPAKDNLILTQRDLDPARPSPIAATSHADFVLLADGQCVTNPPNLNASAGAVSVGSESVDGGGNPRNLPKV